MQMRVRMRAQHVTRAASENVLQRMRGCTRVPTVGRSQRPLSTEVCPKYFCQPGTDGQASKSFMVSWEWDERQHLPFKARKEATKTNLSSGGF